jgi:hypothetical protein
MSVSVTATAPRRRQVHDFLVGDVLGTAARTFIGNAVVFLPISAIAALPFPYLTYVFVNDPSWGYLAILWMMFLLVLLGAFCNAVMLHGTFQEMRGLRARPFVSVRHGLRRFPFVFGTSLLATVCIVLGFVCLVIPGVIINVVLFVALPACVVERAGPTASLSRSASLTKNFRWRIFGLVAFVGIANAIVGKVIEVIAFQAESLWFYIVANYIWYAIWMGYAAIVTAVAYHDLRAVKEGVDTDAIAAVFD